MRGAQDVTHSPVGVLAFRNKYSASLRCRLCSIWHFLISCDVLQEKGSFTIVLSGGSLLKALSHLASKPGMDFSKWYVAYADERNVPHSAEDSNHKGATDAFLSRVGLLLFFSSQSAWTSPVMHIWYCTMLLSSCRRTIENQNAPQKQIVVHCFRGAAVLGRGWWQID